MTLPFCFVIIIRTKTEGLSARALARFTARACRAAQVRGEVNVVLTSGREVRDLNRCFRGKDEPTDVLSFPPVAAGQTDLGGDIIICARIARQNANRLGHGLAAEVKILILHGLLHLAGYDHENDSGEMLRKEARLRRNLRLPVGLIERAASARVGPGLRPGPGRAKTSLHPSSGPLRRRRQ